MSTRVSDTARVRADGKFFACDGVRFGFRGVTYGTFGRRADGALYPEADVIAADMAAIADAGFTVVRTYTPPPEDLLAAAARSGLRIFAGAFFEDWRYGLGKSRREWSRVIREARVAVRDAARSLAGNPTVAALSISNEVPADVVRWVGGARVARMVSELAEVVREEDPELLVTYGNYPSTEYLELPGLDFLTFNVFLERETELHAYLARLHNLAGDRPVVLGEIGLDAGRDEALQAQTLDWQLATALERGIAGTCIFSWTDEWWVGDRPVEGWRFGLTGADRQPRAGLEVAAKWNRTSLSGLKTEWPSMSVVVCARNAQDTLEECLEHVCGLDYPGLEVIVVNDGSTDGTALKTLGHEARVITLPPSGLSSARNAGARAARGEIVAFLDSDAFPPPEWPYLIALGFDTPTVGCVGGPNLAPRDDPLVAQAVASSPGGPVHVLISDDRAEHVPGCNMAFWKDLIIDLDGFDPVFTTAGDDVDFCWRVLDAGWDVAFHPAAFVWHRRRATVWGYLRQQRGYGRAEALVQARHPDRFTSTGTARWRGSIYGSLARRVLRARIYHGEFGSAAYQSVYRGTGHGLEISHQLGAPAAMLAILSAPAGLVSWPLALPAIAGALWLLALALLDAASVAPPVGLAAPRRMRSLAALLHLLQPAARLWGRLPGIAPTRRNRRRQRGSLPGPSRRLAGGVLLLPLATSRIELAQLVVSCLHQSGLRVVPCGPWDAFDAVVHGSTLITGRLVTSAHPEGSMQLRIDRRVRPRRLALLVAAIAALATAAPLAAVGLAVVGALETARGIWRAGPGARAVIERTARADA